MKKNKLFLIVFFVIFIVSNSYSNDIDAMVNNILYNDATIENNKIKNQPKDRFVENIKLRGLNKITGKTFEINAKVNEKIQIEKLEILPLKCWKSYPQETPENKLLVKIYEIQHNDNKKLIFYGWLFSSSPSISGLENPLYDITLVNCVK